MTYLRCTRILKELLTGNFTLSCVNWDSFNVDCVCRVFWHIEHILAKHGLDVLEYFELGATFILVGVGVVHRDR